MIITATDAKRLLKVIRARAGRASTQIRRIENATKLKRPRAETIANIVTSLQTRQINSQHEWTVASALRDFRFWMMLFGILFICFTTQGVILHSVARAVDAGYTKMQAAFTLSLLGIMSAGGKIVWGSISDYIGRRYAYLFAGLFILVGILLLINLDAENGIVPLYIFAVLFGFGYGGAAPLNAAIGSDIFAGDNFASIYGWIMTGFAVGAALGPWLIGRLFDIRGTYNLSFVLAGVSVCVAVIIFWIVCTSTLAEKSSRSDI